MIRDGKTAILLALAAISTPLSADPFEDVQVGESFSEAQKKLSRYGEAQLVNLGGYLGWLVGDYVVLSCDGKVWSVSRTLSPEFRSFTSAAKKAELRFGLAPRATITNDDGRDQQAGIELVWGLGDGTNWSVAYLSNSKGFGVSEARQARSLCNRR